MLGTKFHKNGYDLAAYEQAAAWCNENGATIEDKGEYYEVCAVPEPSAEEDAERERSERIAAIRERLAALSYVSEELALGLAIPADYAAEIDEIAGLHNALFAIEEG